MPEMRRWTVPEPYLHINCTLGEGPFYDETRNELRWVDIWDHKVHFVNLTEGPSSLRTIDTETSIGVTADIEGSEDLLVAAKYGFAIMDRRTGKFDYKCRVWEGQGPEKEKRMRFNDGAVDSHGRYWAGVMNDPKVQDPTDEGVLFRLDPDMKLHKMVETVTIPNGIGWNRKDDTMFWTDSPTKNIYAFDFDSSTGNISNQRVFFHLEDKVGVPDGFAIDQEGYIWSAVYYGGKVIRISPDGEVVGEVSLPTRHITCPVFVGEDLFITSAADADSDDSQSRKYGGDLFRVHVGVGGNPKYKFKLERQAAE